MKQKLNFKHKRGFFSLFSLFIICMLIAIAGVWLWQKYESVTLPEGAAKDPIAYVNGIRDKITGIQGQQNEQNNRAQELAGNTQTVTDKNNLISLAVPQDWAIVSSAGAAGNQLSKMVLQSPDFRTHQDNSNTVYDGGVQLVVQITRGESGSFQSADGGHGNLFVSTQDTDIDSSKGPMHTYKSFDGSSQTLLDAHILNGGNTYLFQFFYNSNILHTGEAPFQFKEILASVKFLQK